MVTGRVRGPSVGRVDLPLYVPARTTSAGAASIQLGRLPNGGRVGIAFTDLSRLRAATGPRQDWVRMSPVALQEMLEPLGVSVIQIDPVLVGADVSPDGQLQTLTGRAG